ncbi:uncharacterized protein LOC119093157 [Pollicipes pollicipes]|uniref:uncharacterized protein LOC119093157 n=1 Tax=Pollicipes pollicipes TaxID=41117 RepID=UPI001884CBDD|nr:uncharacterized protein LOC119093157 [Pollicipes pollicipes]
MTCWHRALLLIGGLGLCSDVIGDPRSLPDTVSPADRKPCPGDDVIDVFVVINARGLVGDDDLAVWRRLEMIWHASEVLPDDKVILYDTRPPLPPVPVPLLEITAAHHPDSFFTTNITIPKFNFSDAPVVSHCLGVGVAYVRNGLSVASNCLYSRPDWMYAAAADLRGLRLHEVMLPGTHDAASYRDYEGKKTDDDLFTRYASAQEETLLTQFFLGARYFDARVAFYPSRAERFWVSHGFVPFRPFSVVVDDLVAMLERTREIVVFEIGGFEGAFDKHPEAYQELLDALLPRLERWLAPLPPGAHHQVLLGDLWASDRRLVLSWDADASGYDILWPRVPNTWHNDDTPEALYDTLNRSMADAPRPELWALAGEMTDHPNDIIFDRLKSLRDMADAVNRNVSRMVRYDWWDLTNIVMADFFMSTYNADTAVLVNWQRAHCR